MHHQATSSSIRIAVKRRKRISHQTLACASTGDCSKARLAELGFDNDREMKKASAVKKKSDLSLTEPSHSSERKDF
jgi:hypothetical protein